MGFPTGGSKQESSVSGTATVDISGWRETVIQVTVRDVNTGVDTAAALMIMPSGASEYRKAKDKDGAAITVDLSATPADADWDFLIEGSIDFVKLVSAQSGDDFTLHVGAARGDFVR